MIEQGIYFALGCIVTALAALGFTPLLWRRALRLTRRRLQLQVPLSMQEILAERDQLRAEFAVERVRMEQAMARVRATKAADMVEIGRRTVDAVALADHVAALRRLEQAQDSEIKLLTWEKAETGAEAGAAIIALHDAHALADRLKRSVEDLSEEVRRLREDVEGKRAAIAGLEAQLAEARRRHGDGLGGWLKAAVAQVTGRDTAGHDGAGHDGAGHDGMSHDGMGHVGAGILAQDTPPRAGIEAAHDRETVVNLRQSLLARAGRDQGRDLGRDLGGDLGRDLGRDLERDQGRDLERGSGRAEEMTDALRAENATLRDALAAARREAAAAPLVDREADAALRDSIHALGLAVAGMTREAERQARHDGAPVKVEDADTLSGLAQGKAPRPLEAN